MTKPSANLHPLDHRGDCHIKVEIANNEACKSRIRKVKGRKWSQTHRCWYVPYTQEAFHQLKTLFDVRMSEKIIGKIKEEKIVRPSVHAVQNNKEDLLKIVGEDDRRIKVFVPYHKKDWIEKIKSIPGRAWNESEKYWSLPLVQTTVNSLKGWFGELVEWRMKIPDKLPETYRPKGWNDKPENKKNKEHTIVLKKRHTHQAHNLPGQTVAKVNIPSQSLNKLNIKPGIKPKFQSFNSDGLESSKVTGDCIVILKSSDHFLEAYIPLNKKGWVVEIKGIPGRNWSVESKCWRLPYTVETVTMLYRAFGSRATFTFRPSHNIPQVWADSQRPRKRVRQVLPAHRESLVALEEQLMLERKSHTTIKSYKNNLLRFLAHYKETPPADISVKQVRDYLLYLINEKGISESTQNSVINAIKAYYEKVLGQERKMYYVPRPKRRNRLPSIFSEKEVVNLLQSAQNTKHKCVLMLIYSAGLRLGELVNLKTHDIDPDRMRVFVHAGKGKKDRYTLLSKKAMLHLQGYLKECTPSDWLFEGQDGGQYSKSSVQKIFKRACEKAGIKKPVTVHSLRHSFATHLHERGISLRHIQGLLGHESSKTTEIYTHLTSKGFDKLESPLDNLDF